MGVSEERYGVGNTSQHNWMELILTIIILYCGNTSIIGRKLVASLILGMMSTTTLVQA